jgi:multiple sugar transport system permease protein
MAFARIGAAQGGGVPRRHSAMARREAMAGYIFLLPWIVGFLWFTLGPVLGSLGLSLTDYSGAVAPAFIGLGNYRQMFLNDPLFWQSLKVTTIFSVLSVPLGLVLSLAIALLLNQRVRFLSIWRTIYYLPALVTGAALALLWQYMFNEQFGLFNAVLNLVHLPSVPWLSSEFWVIPSLVIASLWGVGGGMLIFLGGLQGIPTELYEAAMIDGANAWRKFWHVTIPMLSPTIFYNLIFGIIASFQVFVLVFLLTGGAASGGNPGGPNYASYVFSIFIYQTAFQFGRLGYAAALGWVLFALILALTLVVFRSARFWVFYAGER